LLLCAQAGDLGLEAVLDVVRQASPHAVLHLKLNRKKLQRLPEQADDFGLVVGQRTGEEFDTDLRELSIAALLGTVVAVAALDVEEADGLGPGTAPGAVELLLDDGGGFRHQADVPVALVLERVHLAEDFRAGFGGESALLPEVRQDHFLIAQAGEGTAESSPWS